MERRKRERRSYSEYMRLMNENTGELVGHLADISLEGFRLESRNTIPVNTDYIFRIEVPSEIANKPFMVFAARSKWCKRDNIDPSLFDAGFQIVGMDPMDNETYKVMFGKYGSVGLKPNSPADYLWGR
jgi:hypothetical protein